MADYEAKMIVDELQEAPVHAGDFAVHPYTTGHEAVMYRGAPGGAAAVFIEGIDVLSSTSLRVRFNTVVRDNEALDSLDIYRITPALEILSITPEPGGTPTYVILETAEQKDGESYTVEIQAVEAPG